MSAVPSCTVSDGVSVSVVICSYNLKRWDDLCAAVTSVLAQEPSPSECIVVVDHNAALQTRVAERFPSISVVANRHGPGLSGARNTGVEVSSGALILFLDDDAVAAPDMIARLVIDMEDERALGVVARIDPQWLGKPPRWFPPEFLWVVGCTYRGMSAGRVRNLLGAAMCMRRDVFDAVGGFTDGVGRARSGLPLGCEETELCIRANNAFAGRWFLYDPDAVCLHKVPVQRATWRYFAVRCYAEGWSKAFIRSLLQSSAALSTERTYVRQVLLSGAAAGVRDAVTKGDIFALLRSAAIAIGLGVTVAGYLAGILKLRVGAIFVKTDRQQAQLDSAFARPTRGR